MAKKDKRQLLLASTKLTPSDIQKKIFPKTSLELEQAAQGDCVIYTTETFKTPLRKDLSNFSYH